MKITVLYEKRKLTSTLSSSISTKDIISNLRKSLNDYKTDFLLLNEDCEILKDSNIIEPKVDKEVKFFLLPQQKIPELPKQPEVTNIEELIMKVTEANEKLVAKKYNQRNRDNFYESLPNDHNLRQLLSIIRNLEERNNEFRNNNNNQPMQPNENYVKELKEMGFPEDRARAALIRARNDIERATEILLNNENEMEEDNNNHHHHHGHESENENGSQIEGEELSENSENNENNLHNENSDNIENNENNENSELQEIIVEEEEEEKKNESEKHNL